MRTSKDGAGPIRDEAEEQGTWEFEKAYPNGKVERERDGAKVDGREGQARPRREMLDCNRSARLGPCVQWAEFLRETYGT